MKNTEERDSLLAPDALARKFAFLLHDAVCREYPEEVVLDTFRLVLEKFPDALAFGKPLAWFEPYFYRLLRRPRPWSPREVESASYRQYEPERPMPAPVPLASSTPEVGVESDPERDTLAKANAALLQDPISMSILTKMSISPADAEDIRLDTFLEAVTKFNRVHPRLAKMDEEKKFPYYLRYLVAKRGKSFLRTRHDEVSLDEPIGHEEDDDQRPRHEMLKSSWSSPPPRVMRNPWHGQKRHMESVFSVEVDGVKHSAPPIWHEQPPDLPDIPITLNDQGREVFSIPLETMIRFAEDVDASGLTPLEFECLGMSRSIDPRTKQPMSIKEIARRLGVTQQTIQGRLRSARQKESRS
jgi:DNA-directed RNA polymerase specialized sigma24 family protein